MVKGGLMITDSADWTDVRRRTGEEELFLINDEGLMMTEDLMDYILSGYTLYENKGETWKYGQVLTKIQNTMVSLQRICDDFGQLLTKFKQINMEYLTNMNKEQ